MGSGDEVKVAFISQWFDPEVGSAAIPGAIVRSLQARGNEVEVVTGFPNYPRGRLYDGYRMRPYKRETLRGTTVHRVPLYPSHDGSAARRALCFLTFMLSASTLGVWLSRRCAVALVYSTPATVGMAGVVSRRLFGRPFVLYIQDMWPDTVTATGMVPGKYSRPVEWLLGFFCRMVYRSAARIAVISPGMKDLLVGRGVSSSKVDVIYNWVDEDVFRHVPHTLQSSTFEVMYAGNIGDVQGLEVAVNAMAAIDANCNAVLRLVGDGVARPRLERLAEDLGVAHRVRFEGSRDVKEMAELMASADVQLVSLRDDPLFHITMPSKIQSILACGQALIVCAPGDAARLADECGAGVAVPAGNAAALAQAIREMSALPLDELLEMGARGRRFYEERLSSAVGARMLEEALTVALRQGSA